MPKPIVLAMLFSIQLGAQTSNIDLYKRLQAAVSLPVATKLSPPGKIYEGRLYIKNDNPIYVIEIGSESGKRLFFTLDSATNVARVVIGPRRISHGMAVTYNQTTYQFVCAYCFGVVD